MPKFSLDDFDARMNEVRLRLRPKHALPAVGSSDLISRLREAARKQRGVGLSLPKLSEKF